MMKYLRILWDGQKEGADSGKPKRSNKPAERPKASDESAMLSAISNAKARLGSAVKSSNVPAQQNYQLKDADNPVGKFLQPTYKREGGETAKDSLSQFFK